MGTPPLLSGTVHRAIPPGDNVCSTISMPRFARVRPNGEIIPIHRHRRELRPGYMDATFHTVCFGTPTSREANLSDHTPKAC